MTNLTTKKMRLTNFNKSQFYSATSGFTNKEERKSCNTVKFYTSISCSFYLEIPEKFVICFQKFKVKSKNL